MLGSLDSTLIIISGLYSASIPYAFEQRDPYMRCGLRRGTEPQRVLAEGLIEIVDQLFCSCVGQGCLGWCTP